MAQPVGAFRADYRQRRLPARYSGALHALSTTLILGTAVTTAIALLDAVEPLEWLTIPAIFLISNLFEYALHRAHLHHPLPGARALFRIHTLEHHSYFTAEAMALEGHRDLHMILLPWWSPMLAAFVGYPSFGALVAWLLTPNVACLMIATAASYFLMYEALHFCHHAPEGSLIARLPLLRTLREHHRAHHDKALMGRRNFNITLPIFDWLLGTTHKP